MALKGYVDNWSNRPHGERKQAQVISYILDQTDYFESIDYDIPISRVFVQCEDETKVCRTVIRKWWIHFGQYGELPYETKAHFKRIRKKTHWLPIRSTINEAQLQQLKTIIDQSPSLYLDEIVVIFGIQTGMYFHPTTIWLYMTNHLDYSLQYLTERAMQRNQVERENFKHSLGFYLQNNPDMLIMVDETHKDRNAARRRRGYGKRNDGGLNDDKWFKDCVCYTLIGVADINGFVESACNTYDRKEIREEGAAGTVTREVFEHWVEHFLVPVLGDYSKGEPRSVVLLDNASTHNSDKAVQMIEATGAMIQFTAPFSPDLNPIENYFSLYKKCLKRNCDEMIHNWEEVHFMALKCVNRNQGIRYFRRCDILAANNVMTTDEEEENAIEEIAFAIVTILIIRKKRRLKRKRNEMN